MALDDILAEARDRIIEHMGIGDEFLHRLQAKGDDTLKWNDSVRDHIERVLNEIEGLRRRLADMASD